MIVGNVKQRVALTGREIRSIEATEYSTYEKTCNVNYALRLTFRCLVHLLSFP